MSESNIPHVFAAIANVTKAISSQGISKSRRNQQGAGYQFRGIDDVYNALSGYLASEGLCIIPRCIERTQEERTAKSGMPLFYTVVHVEFTFASAKDGSTHVASMYGEAMDSSDKSTNKAMSAAFKYVCLQTFCIPTEADNDADAHTPEPVAKTKPDPVAGAEKVTPLATKEQLSEIAHFSMRDETEETVNKALAYYKVDPKNVSDLTQRQANTIINKCSKLIPDSSE